MPRLVEKLIAPIAGLTSEAIAHQRRKSQTPSPNPETHGSQHLEGLNLSDQNTRYESNEEQWELDSIAEEIHASEQDDAKIPKGNWMSPASIETLVSKFLESHIPGGYDTGSYLALPVVIPQKRPGKKDRGFVRAYSPVLEDCGIDQNTWLNFLDTFHESIKVSPAFDVINVSVGVLGMFASLVPGPAIQAATTVINVADTIAKETYTRSRTNKFLVEMNERYFKPQGLYCLVISYKPETDSVVDTVDINTTVSKVIAHSDAGGSGANPARSAPASGQSENAELNEKIKRTLKLWTGRSSAVTRGELEMPAAAPLIFPDLDQAGEEERKSWFSRGKAFAVDYFDKRERAQWQSENPDATLANLSPSPEFLSQRGDPRNTKQNSSILTTITGRESRFQAHRRQMKDSREEKRSEKWDHQADSGRGVRGLVAKATKGKPPIVAVKKVLKMDVMYMLLIRIPSQEQIQAAEMGSA